MSFIQIFKMECRDSQLFREIQNMKYSVIWQNQLLTLSHIACILGLLFSETRILINSFGATSAFYVPHFTIFYFSASTINLSALIIKYSFFKGCEGAAAIEFFQHLGLPISVILLRLFLQHDSANSFPKILCLILFSVQCVLISLKIIYLGSISKELAQISGLTKLSRILKLAVMAIFPQFISADLPLVIILTICQLFTVCMFVFKFTYQKCSVQYVLLIGVLAGFVSSLEDTLCTIFEYNYFFLGECFIVAVFLLPQTYLLSVFELKYRLLFTGQAENKSEDQHLAQLLFLRQCIFTKHQTLNYSQTTKNQAILQIASYVQRIKKSATKESQSNEVEVQEESYLFLGQIQKGGTLLQQSFFQLILGRFKETSNFQAFLFSVYCALQLQQKYSTYAMILFYRFRERTLHKRSNLQQCRYEILYSQIIKHFSAQYKDPQQIAFVEFSQSLDQLSQAIQKCLTDEIQLIEALTNDGKKRELFADSKLLKQHKIKRRIRKIFDACFQNKLYLNSNQFKYIYLLYQTAVEKRYAQIKKTIKTKFLSAQVKNLQFNYFPKYLTVLNGFSNGEIVISNQAFKNYFKFSASSQTKSTISQLFPTDKQKRRHNSLLLESYQQVCQREGDHSKYECLLAVQAQANNYKFKVLESFTIATRIYCENPNAFNYVCQFIKLNESDQDIVTIQKKERDMLDKKGLCFIPKNIRTVKQLDDQFEICDIQGDFRNESFVTITKLSNFDEQPVPQPKKQGYCPDYSLSEKIKLIEQKMMQEKKMKQKVSKFRLRGLVQLLLIIMLEVSICLSYWNLSTSIGALNQTVTVQMKDSRDTNLVRNRIMVQKLILSMVKGTAYFPDSICAFEQLSNLTSYFIDYATNDLLINFDDYLALQVSKQDQSYLPQLYSSAFSSLPYLSNYKNNVTLQKYVSLLKAQYFYWLYQMQNGKTVRIDYNYYFRAFPNQLLSYSVFANNSVYLNNRASLDSFFQSLLSLTNQLKIIFSISAITVGILIIAFRIKDTIPLVQILAAFESINNKILSSRLKQLKYSLNLLQRIKTTRLMSLLIDSHGFVTIQNDKQLVEIKALQNFNREGKITRKNNANQDQSELETESSAFLKYQQLQNSHHLPKSHTIRSLLYNRWYLVIVLLAVGSITVICLSFLTCFTTKIQALQNYQTVDQNLTLLNEKFINIVAFNWLKALSVITPNSSMNSAYQLYKDSLATFKTINLQNLLYSSYSNNLANQLLYGNVCKYFNSPESCTEYRTGAFTEGLSVILPFTIKQQIEGSEISSTNYSYYIPNACDKTYILFEGVVPLNKRVPLYGLQVVLGNIDGELSLYILTIDLLIVVLLLMTLFCQMKRRSREQKLQEQVLSLDTVENLYHISDLKPYFNKIYYS